LVGCGGGKSGGDSTITQTVYDINGKTVDQLNGSTAIYTLLTAQPASKPESNSISSIPSYSTTFSTTAAITSNYAASTISFNHFNGFEGQAKVDSVMREKENSILSSGVKQSLKSASRINLSTITTPITVDSTKWSVKVYNYQTQQMETVSTTCKYVSDYAYFFVDDRDSVSSLSSYGNAFNAIYLKNHTKFGEETNTDGIDKIIIVFSQVLAETNNLLGYFNAEDKFLTANYPDSNECDVLYLTTASTLQQYIPATMAHEFQHMIYFDQHYKNGVTNTYTWLNEALSQAAEYYNGYDGTSSNHYEWIQAYLAGDWKYGLSLTYWSDDNYGYGALFIRYLIEQYGDTAIKNMCSTGKVGIAAVEAATGTDFNTIFTNFTRALVLSNTGKTADSRYNFTTLNLATIQTSGRKGLATSYTYNAGNTLTGNLYPYMIYFAKWSGNFGSMTLTSSSKGGASGTVFGLDY
jgi:hypothetical protein